MNWCKAETLLRQWPDGAAPYREFDQESEDWGGSPGQSPVASRGPGSIRDQARRCVMTVVIEGVTKTFRRSRAVACADFTAGHGVTGVLGPSGAGKTTLLRMMATVLAPDSGRLRLLGHDPATPSGRLAIPPPPRLPAAGARFPSRHDGVRVR
jgi:ABC-type microcin C transport system duplicated ATPase subunit YejF